MHNTLINRTMKKTVVRISNVFCVEIDGRYKCYFQYVCRDRVMLNGQVIKVFKTRYPMDYEPVLDDIVRDEVAFYAHTIIRAGLYYNAWYKVGQSAPIVSDDHEKVVWGIANDIVVGIGLIHNIYIDPMENWILWYTNQNRFQIGGVFPESYCDKVEYGALIAFVDIVNRIKLGYYTYTCDEYAILKRIPHPDVHSYTRKESEGTVVYMHFLGENVMQEILVTENGEAQLSEGNPLQRPLFWETNWKRKELITKEEFEEAWTKYGVQ